MNNVRSTKLRRRTPALALFALAAVLWTTASEAACVTGYYRFTSSMTNAANAVNQWSAAPADYTGNAPHGISFFMDLTQNEYDTMNVARALTRPPTSYVYRIPCNDLILPLTYTQLQINLTDWTQAGGAKHGVISTATATGGRNFNRTPVGGMRANAYLLSKAVYVTED